MTEELRRKIRSAARRRIRIIRKEHGIKYGDGSTIRCLGRFLNPDMQVYYVYEISYAWEREMITGLRHFDLFTDEVEESYRHATYDEMMEIMHGLWDEVFVN